MDEQQLADTVADMVEDILNDIVKRTGIPLGLVLVGAHAGLVCKLTEFIGGQATADICGRAAKHVQHLPSLAEAMAADVLKGGNGNVH